MDPPGGLGAEDPYDPTYKVPCTDEQSLCWVNPQPKSEFCSLNPESFLICTITYRGLNNYLYYFGVPYYNYSIAGPKPYFILTPILYGKTQGRNTFAVVLPGRCAFLMASSSGGPVWPGGHYLDPE